jgi:hypothetical protein
MRVYLAIRYAQEPLLVPLGEGANAEADDARDQQSEGGGEFQAHFEHARRKKKKPTVSANG